VNLRVAVLEESVAEKRPFSSLLAPDSRRNVCSHSTRGPNHDILSVSL
jgi:hypothetical protein